MAGAVSFKYFKGLGSQAGGKMEEGAPLSAPEAKMMLNLLL